MKLTANGLIWLVILASPALSGLGGELSNAQAMALFTQTPAPDYPLSEKRAQQTGRGIYRLTLDEQGSVIAVKTVKSTGFDGLDKAATNVFGRWKAKPGARREVDIPFTFSMPVNRIFISPEGAKIVPMDSESRGRIVLVDPKTSRKLVYSRRDVNAQNRSPSHSTMPAFVLEGMSDAEAARLLAALEIVVTIPRW